MDRRTVLAMVLFLAIFLAWTKFMESQRPPVVAAGADSLAAAPATAAETPVRDVVTTPARERPDIPADTPVVPADFAFPSAGDQTYTVTTDLFRATFSEAGGVLVSWEGLEFPGLEEGTDVELVPPHGDFDPPRAGDVLVYERGALDLSDASFRPAGSATLSLGPDDAPRDFVLVASTAEGLVVEKILTFTPGLYTIGLRYDVRAETDAARVALDAALGDPQSVRFVWNQGIAVTEHGVKTMMRRDFDSRSFAMVGEELSFRNAHDLGKDNGKGVGAFQGSVRFAGLQSKYFSILGFVPRDEEVGTVSVGRIRLGGDAETGRQSWEIELPLRGDYRGSAAGMTYYVGPTDYHRLRAHNNDLQTVVNLGWKWIQPISELVLKLMNWLHGFIPNYGWVIIIISILSKLVFYPLTARGTRAMKKMQESQARLKPKLDALKKKWSSDPQRLNQETMKLYKEEGVNPMAGMGGCLPLLIQMPIFFALYQVLFNMVDLRMAPWILWIDDLSRPDALFTLPFSIPLMGSYINLLPLLMAAATWYQTKLTPQSGAGGQMAAMTTLMPIMMLFFLYNMPSGLVIYWTINTVMTAFQSWQVNRTTPATGGAEA